MISGTLQVSHLTPPHRLGQHKKTMATTPKQTRVNLVQGADYRESYSNSVQIRVNVWDFMLMFGTMHQNVPETVEIRNFQGVYLSPQQAKALLGVLQQNVAQYENAFGEINLDPNAAQAGAAVQ